jgi:hypothetical protein
MTTSRQPPVSKNLARAAAPTAASAPPPEVTATTNPDKVRQDELNTRTIAYQAKVPTDDQNRRDIANVVTTLQDEAKRLAGPWRPQP